MANKKIFHESLLVCLCLARACILHIITRSFSSVSVYRHVAMRKCLIHIITDCLIALVMCMLQRPHLQNLAFSFSIFASDSLVIAFEFFPKNLLFFYFICLLSAIHTRMVSGNSDLFGGFQDQHYLCLCCCGNLQCIYFNCSLLWVLYQFFICKHIKLFRIKHFINFVILLFVSYSFFLNEKIFHIIIFTYLPFEHKEAEII